MKRIITLAILLLSFAYGMAQSPQKMSFQAVVRNNTNTLLSNQAVGLKMSILQGSATGAVVYSETQTATTNANGLVSIQIGGGSVLSGDFATIAWANGPYFIQTETDVNGGTNYTLTSTTQLLSVPYALYAQTSGSSIAGPQGPIGLTGPAGTNGTNGVNGANGPQGPQGIAGINGTNGQDGLSAYQIWLNAGNIGTEAQFLNSLQGQTGLQGPIGLTGATGPAGANGTNGIDGTTGQQGPQGIQGIKGDTGLTGATGPQGPIGLTGPAGTNGTNGSDGATGPQGPQGIKGDTGLTGATGPQGPIGLTGPAGANGTNGSDGVTGQQGPQGIKGDTGLTGLTGLTGWEGLVFSFSCKSCDDRLYHLVELGFDLGREISFHLVNLGEFGERPSAIAFEVVHTRHPVNLHGVLLLLGVLSPVAFDFDDQVQQIVIAMAVINVHDEVRQVFAHD